MKLNELTKNELIELLNIIFECGCLGVYIKFDNIVLNYLMNRFNKQFDCLMNELDKIKFTTYLDVIEYEKLSKKMDKLESEREQMLVLEELEQHKQKKIYRG